MRKKLENRRSNTVSDLSVRGIAVSVQFGYDSNGKVKEIFINTRKFGSDADTTLRDLAILFSFLLQYGCPIDEVIDVLSSDTYGNPDGIAGTIARLIKENENEAI